MMALREALRGATYVLALAIVGGCGDGDGARALTERLGEAAFPELTRYHRLVRAVRPTYERGQVDSARAMAKELAELSITSRPFGRERSDGIHQSETILGRIALREGRTMAAKAHLLAAAEVEGSPVLVSFGPNMALAKELLEAGERDTVLAYFDACSRFWEHDYGQLASWRKTVVDGGYPDFKANLLY